MDIFLCGFGHPGLSVLDRLFENGYNVAVFTHDKLPNAPSLTEKAKELGYWSTTETVNAQRIWPFEPELIISIYYRNIINAHVIKRVKRQIFNAHPSLLPKHRGCSAIPWSIIDGDSHTGITFHWIDAGIDTGKIILQATCQIEATDTQLTLQNKINQLVTDYFPYALDLVLLGVDGVEQRGVPSYHYRQVPYNLQIDPSWPTPKIERYIRAMIYPPYKPAQFGGQDILSLSDFYKVLHASQ